MSSGGSQLCKEAMSSGSKLNAAAKPFTFNPDAPANIYTYIYYRNLQVTAPYRQGT